MPLPFDLEKAKAGWPLVTRDGRKARFFGEGVNEVVSDYPVIAMLDKSFAFFAVSGHLWKGAETGADLFLDDPPTKKVKLWIAVAKERCSTHDTIHFSTNAYTREELAKSAAAHNYAIVPIEIEVPDESFKP